MGSVVEDVELTNIAGHTYRIRVHPITGSRSRSKQAAAAQQQDWQAEVFEELEILTIDDEQIDESLISQEGDSHVTHLSVDPQLLPFIIGKGGNTIKQLEQETGTKLIIPKGGPVRRDHHQHPPKQQQQQQQQQQRHDPLIIKGSSKQAVSSARVRTQLLIDSVIDSRMLDFNFFVSIPLANDQTAAKLQDFQQKVLAQHDAQQQGFDPSIFINPATLHLTLLMLKLYSDEARSKAAEALQGLHAQVSKLLGGQPLRLCLKGLDYMRDDPTDIHVLYLKVGEGGAGQKLSKLCDLVMRGFQEAGLLLKGQGDSVKLHATVINTRHRRTERSEQQQQPEGGQHRRKQPDRRGFNGQKLLQDWKDIDLGEYVVPALQISQRGNYDPESGYYACFDALKMQP